MFITEGCFEDLLLAAHSAPVESSAMHTLISMQSKDFPLNSFYHLPEILCSSWQMPAQV